jgi:hypothetical protein
MTENFWIGHRTLSLTLLTEWRIEAAALAPLQPLLAAYETAFAAYKSPNHGKEDTLNKNDARDALKAEIRAFAKANLLYNRALANAGRDRIGIPVHDNKRSPVPPPSTYPKLHCSSRLCCVSGIINPQPDVLAKWFVKMNIRRFCE